MRETQSVKIAIIGAGHWHVSIYYLPALKKLGADIVAIADPSPQVLDRIGQEVDCPKYTDYRELLDAEEVDLVFAHAPHSEMTAVAAELVARHQPFHMEKPMGVDWRKLEPVAAQARTENVFTSVALVSRYLGVAEKLTELKTKGELGGAFHYYFRLLAGPPQRYIDWGVGWMLDPATAGAGPLFNFGPHVFDLFLYLTGQHVVEVSARWFDSLHHQKIEDFASATILGDGGAIGVCEVGYILPSGYERYFSLTTDMLHYGGPVQSGSILMRNGREVPFSGLDGDQIYFKYTSDVLDCYAAGRPPRATIHDMVATLRVMNTALQSAQTGRPVRLDGCDEE